MRRGIFALLLLSYVYFYQAGGWNQNSRFALVRAVTNDWSLRIDPYQRNTGDKAFYDGHYYSDKAPGLAIAALPVVEPARLIYMAVGGDPETFAGLALLSYLATIFTNGLMTAWAGVLLFDVARECGATPGAAVFAALSFGLATPMWPLATIFIGHALSAACLVWAFAAAAGLSLEAASRGLTAATARVPASRSDGRTGATVGLAAGWATVSEFPAAVPAVVLALWTAASAAALGKERARPILLSMTAGAAACAVVLMAYQYACFGSPFHLAYSSEQGFEGMQQGFFGITAPSLSTLNRILLGEYRGLLPLSPLMAVTAAGFFFVWRVPGAAFVAAIIATYYVLLNGSYHYWEGGWSLGPRHLSPALPFLCLALAPLWHHARPAGRGALTGLWLASAGITLMSVATMPQPPANISRPFRELVWPAFRDGDLSLNTQTFVHYAIDPALWRTHEDPKAAFNLGMKIGLDGHVSLVPLALGWGFFGIWLWRATREESRVNGRRDAADDT